MGPEGAVNIIFRDEIAAASDTAAERVRLRTEYEDRFANPYIAAGRGYIDDVIMPADTRPRLIAELEMLAGKRQTNLPRKHGNIPL
jgi:propionyl-CoA carboxylase beta chain